jgi:outer membrane protein OmpA-like peptidoglycan-associated protein
MRALPPYADRDQDGDGIRNRSDLCPREAEDRDGYADADGCPDRDDDNDGVPDADDKCLSEVEDRDGFEDDDGCPDLDDDRDGIADRRDLCPRQPETVNGHRDSDGCPDGIPDSDGDGIVDRDDKCPSQSGESQLGGCPPPRVLRADIAAKLPTAIRFSLGGARLGPDADAPLAALAELLRTTPELEVLAVRGHSSSDGKAAANRKLSEARANAVLNALVMLGIDPARLRAEGLGSTEPAANNATAKGRTSNRRVDFAIHSWKPR